MNGLPWWNVEPWQSGPTRPWVIDGVVIEPVMWTRMVLWADAGKDDDDDADEPPLRLGATREAPEADPARRARVEALARHYAPVASMFGDDSQDWDDLPRREIEAVYLGLRVIEGEGAELLAASG